MQGISPSKSLTAPIKYLIIKDSTVPKEIFEDDYFRQNLPSSYGAVSRGVPSSTEGDDHANADMYTYDAEQSIFGGETERCSRGFQDMSRNLRALHNRHQSEASVFDDHRSKTSHHSKPATSADYNKLTESLRAFQSIDVVEDSKGVVQPRADGGYENDDDSSVGYERVSENLSVFGRRRSEPTEPAPPPPTDHYNRLSENFAVFESSIDTTSSPFSQFRPNKPPPRPPEHFNKLTENLKVLRDAKIREEEEAAARDALGPDNSRYNNFASQMSAAFGRQQDNAIKGEDKTKLVEAYAYQNVTCEGLGYTGGDVGVRPYAIAKFNFVAEFDAELGLQQGDVVFLNR